MHEHQWFHSHFIFTASAIIMVYIIIKVIIKPFRYTIPLPPKQNQNLFRQSLVYYNFFQEFLDLIYQHKDASSKDNNDDYTQTFNNSSIRIAQGDLVSMHLIRQNMAKRRAHQNAQNWTIKDTLRKENPTATHLCQHRKPQTTTGPLGQIQSNIHLHHITHHSGNQHLQHLWGSLPLQIPYYHS